MSVHVVGRFLGRTEETRGKPGSEFTAVTLHVLDGVHTHQLEPIKDFRGALPTEGELVVFDVFVSAWKSAAGNVGTQFRAAGRNAEMEQALGFAGESLKAV